MISSENIDIIFSHDIHSFLKPAAKEKTIIDQFKLKNPNTLVVDAGDFSMGTLYQTIFTNHASELRILGEIGVDATTIGNHEFDYGVPSLAHMFDVAADSKDPLPTLVLGNVDWSKNDKQTKTLKASLVDHYGAKEYVIIKKGKFNIAVFGLFGKQANFCLSGSTITINDPISSAKNIVQKIKQNESADLIVCLSHGGTFKNYRKSEDEQLAKAVPEIDVIISGHTHTKHDKPIIHGNTIIGSCEAYGEYLGTINLEQTENDRWKLKKYELIPLKNNNAIKPDEEILKKIEYFDSIVDKEYLSVFGFTTNQVLATTKYDVNMKNQIGYLMADSIHMEMESLGHEVDFVLVPSGVVRGCYKKGKITVADVFESYSLGIGKDGLSGYPLVKFYFTGRDIKTMFELDRLLPNTIHNIRLFCSSLSYDYNPHRLLLDRVVEAYEILKNGEKIPIDDNRLYTGITDIYSMEIVGRIAKMSKGFLNIAPRDKNGAIITDYESALVFHNDGTEIKGWHSIAKQIQFMSSIPDYTKVESERIISSTTINPIKIFNHPLRLLILFLSAIKTLLLLLGTGIFILLKKLIKK